MHIILNIHCLMRTSDIICVYIDAALIQYLEQNRQDYYFHTWMYYILVTIATVGYGDIVPKVKNLIDNYLLVKFDRNQLYF